MKFGNIGQVITRSEGTRIDPPCLSLQIFPLKVQIPPEPISLSLSPSLFCSIDSIHHTSDIANMRLFLYTSCLLFLYSLFQEAICYALPGRIEKRIDDSTKLYELSHDELAKTLDTITAPAGGYEDHDMFWGEEEDRLIALSRGDLLVSVQSTVGAWFCAMHVTTWARISSSHEIYDSLWGQGCRQRLNEKIDYWKKILKNTEHNHGGIPLKFFEVQLFALAGTRGDPNGHRARTLIVHEMKQILGVDFISLLGWPARTSDVGLVVVQRPLDRNDFSAMVDIYSTGSGPEYFLDPTGTTAVDPAFPRWGTTPAISMKLQGGVTLDDCQVIWGFPNAQRMDLNRNMFPDASERAPKNPYIMRAPPPYVETP